jgi:hypothetical protein
VLFAPSCGHISVESFKISMHFFHLFRRDSYTISEDHNDHVKRDQKRLLEEITHMIRFAFIMASINASTWESSILSKTCANSSVIAFPSDLIDIFPSTIRQLCWQYLLYLSCR